LLGKAERGVLICGSGIGMSIAANRYSGIRCALIHNDTLAVLSRQHNNTNVIAFGARFIQAESAWECLLTWLQTPFDGGRHQQRIDKIEILNC
jgi:ribose 5-phosphate isomerase B